jgi:triosephosphate isomerase
VSRPSRGIIPLVAANWKMNGTPSETEALLSELVPRLRDAIGPGPGQPRVEVVIAPPFTSLSLAARMLAGSGVALAAQNCHWIESGPYTGEVSARMLAESGCSYVILGHSERREHFGETDHRINLKIRAALAWDLTPIVCVGEHQIDRETGREELIVEAQLRNCLKLETGQRLAIAYEPVWAIGTGRTPTTAEVSAMHALVREQLQTALGKEGARMPILYGGSANESNAVDLLAAEGVDGALVGAASLKPAAFEAIVRLAGGA